MPGCVGERAAEDSGDVRRSLHLHLKANVVRLPPGVRRVVQQTNKSVGLAAETRPLSSNRSAECRRGG